MVDGYKKTVEGTCTCVVKNREDGETEREWFKRWMCQFHWMQTDYYRDRVLRSALGHERRNGW